MEDDAPRHTNRVWPACTTAIDDARARMKKKAGVEKAYIVKHTLGQKVFFFQIEGSIPSFYIRVACHAGM